MLRRETLSLTPAAGDAAVTADVIDGIAAIKYQVVGSSGIVPIKKIPTSTSQKRETERDSPTMLCYCQTFLMKLGGGKSDWPGLRVSTHTTGHMPPPVYQVRPHTYIGGHGGSNVLYSRVSKTPKQRR